MVVRLGGIGTATLVAWVIGWGGANAQPSNDDCGAALTISMGSTPYSNVGATADGPAPCVTVGADIWFDFVAPETQTVRLSTCGTATYDTVIAVYPATAGCPPDAMTVLACNDDAPGCWPHSVLTFEAVAGETYRIQVAGWQAAEGDGTLTIDTIAPPSAVDLCADALPITEGLYPYSTIGSTTDGPPGCAGIGGDVWFLYSPSCVGEATITTCGQASYDSAIAVYPAAVGCPPPESAAVACNDDASGCGTQTRVTFAVTPTESYLVQVGGWNGATGDGAIEVTCQQVAIDDLVCSSSPGSGTIDVSWVVAADHDTLRLLRNGALLETLPGPFAVGEIVSHSVTGLEPQQLVSLCLEPEVAGIVQVPACCDVAVVDEPGAESCSVAALPLLATGITESSLAIDVDVLLADVQVDVALSHPFIG
ncbi:MAG: hypothetical protein KDC38_08765, partial [Planctomycetes bacterium]|nr:hypothetical protein [Planctomycetota bacterium]